jgi:hypothetical protein
MPTQAKSTTHTVQIINYQNPQANAKKTKADLIARQNCEVKEILQLELFEKYDNWNWIKHSEQDLDLYKKYLENSQSLEIYYNHEKAQKEFGDRFWFDGGSKIDVKDYLNEHESDFWKILDRKKTNFYKFSIDPIFSGFYNKKTKIEFPQGSQGINIFLPRYKILWNKVFRGNYHFYSFIDEKNLMLADNQIMLISSNNKKELLYLFAILNSNLNLKILFLTSSAGEHEQLGTLASITAIKNYIRIPILNTPQKLELKEKLIQKAQSLLDCENKTLQDLVDFDFDGLPPARFDSWAVHDGHVFITLNNYDTWFEIKNKQNERLIYETLESVFGDPTVKVENGINLQEFKKTVIFNPQLQAKIKTEMDKIVENLYEIKI